MASLSAPSILLSLGLLHSDPAAFERLPFEQRMAVISQLFSPRPGGTVLGSAYDLANVAAGSVAQTKQIKGFIKVTPPKGQCIRIIKGIRGDERLVCRPKTLSFRLGDLDQSGALRWQVFTGNSLASLPLVWQSPYRFVQIIELGAMGKKLGHYEPITGCKVRSDGPWYRATVNFLDGRLLKMNFHRADKQLRQLRLGEERIANNGQVPDNMVHERRAGTAHDGEHFGNDPENDVEGHAKKQGKGAEAPSAAAQGKSLGAIINSHMGKGRIIRQYGWVLQSPTAREMNGSRVYLEKIAGQTVGKCRYVFKGSPVNPAEGMVECSYANDFDAILVPLSCTTHLPEPDPFVPKP